MVWRGCFIWYRLCWKGDSFSYALYVFVRSSVWEDALGDADHELNVIRFRDRKHPESVEKKSAAYMLLVELLRSRGGVEYAEDAE